MIDLSDTAIGSLQNFLNPAGQSVVVMTDAQALSRLFDAFWWLRMAGMDILSSWTCDTDGIITPQPNPPQWTFGQDVPTGWYTDTQGATDLGQEIVMAIVVVAAHHAIVAQLSQLQTSLSVKAGPVSYEVQQSSTMMLGVLKNIQNQVALILKRLSDLGFTTEAVFDAVLTNTQAIENDVASWSRGGYADMGGPYRSYSGY